jgi:hypothetical protein
MEVRRCGHLYPSSNHLLLNKNFYYEEEHAAGIEKFECDGADDFRFK